VLRSPAKQRSIVQYSTVSEHATTTPTNPAGSHVCKAAYPGEG
jgi:hypothetical protein